MVCTGSRRGRAWRFAWTRDRGYSFPPGGGVFTLRFAHFNHFSKDAQQLVSEPLTLNLTR